MSEDRLNRLESAMASMAEKFSEYLARDSARLEREKHQEILNDKFESFIEDYKENDKPIVNTSRKWQAASFWWITRIVLPAVIGGVLLSAGYKMSGSAASAPIEIKVKELNAKGDK